MYVALLINIEKCHLIVILKNLIKVTFKLYVCMYMLVHDVFCGRIAELTFRTSSILGPR